VNSYPFDDPFGRIEVSLRIRQPDHMHRRCTTAVRISRDVEHRREKTQLFGDCIEIRETCLPTSRKYHPRSTEPTHADLTLFRRKVYAARRPSAGRMV
jgi:hypothetical protein